MTLVLAMGSSKLTMSLHATMTAADNEDGGIHADNERPGQAFPSTKGGKSCKDVINFLAPLQYRTYVEQNRIKASSSWF